MDEVQAQAKGELTYYDVLGVGRSAKQEEIKAAFRHAVKLYHCDSLPAGSPSWILDEANRRLKQVTEAWSVLQMEDKRAHYDRLLDGLISAPPAEWHPPFGGLVLEDSIVKWLIREFRQETGLDLTSKGNEMALIRLRDAADKSICELAKAEDARIDLPFLSADVNGPKSLSRKVTREMVERLAHGHRA